MPFEQLSDNAHAIVTEIRNIIEKNQSKGDEKPGTGWEYSNPELSVEISRLEEELNKDDFKVLETHVLHLFNNGRIHNITSHAVLIPLNGSSSFGPDEPLRESHYTRQTRTIYGENIDIITVALKEK
ncbi:hypothetical protein BDV25DRAFT_156132 [Aspergillus avenaceus]|uniref:Uncharacterized protein n=1 Tax=Aspergillus avenaceus TaxID=36643 RepID=A0A5N6TT30_ASPAV|nr:hypothetical protein BDV25DRAFT_156132 [Aspergillus avenaceus]